MTLEEIREKIDETDKELFRLFEQRMKLAKEVAETKRVSGDNVYKPEREEEVIERFAENAPENMKQYYRAFIRRVMLISREYQYRIIHGGKESHDENNSKCNSDAIEISFRCDEGIPDGIIAALGDTGVKVTGFSSDSGRYNLIVKNDIPADDMKALLALINNESTATN